MQRSAKRNVSVCPSPLRRFRPRLERLEKRDVPAGNVTVAVVNGALLITGDDLGNDIRIDQSGVGPGQFRISSGADATTINNTAGPLVFTASGNVSIDMAGGGDKVAIVSTVFARRLDVDLGAGDNRLSMNGSQVGKAMVVLGGAEVDELDWISNKFGRGVALDLGAGDNLAVLRDTTVARNLSYLGGADGDRLLLGNLTRIKGALTVDFGSGESVDSFTKNGTLQVGGNAAFTFGPGFEDHALEFFDSTKIKGSLALDLGAGGSNYAIGFHGAMNIGGDLDITFSGDVANFRAIDVGDTFLVKGTVTIDFGDGDAIDAMNLQGPITIHKDFNVRCGAGLNNDVIDIDAPLSVGGSVLFDFGTRESTDAVDIFAAMDVGQNFTLLFGGDEDEDALHGNGPLTIGRDLRIDLGDGMSRNAIEFEKPVVVGRNARFMFGDGIEVDAVDIFSVFSVRKDLSIQFGAGNSTGALDLEGDVSVGRNLSVSFGDGDDRSAVSVYGTVRVKGDATFTFGEGADEETMEIDADLFRVDGDLHVVMGAGDNTFDAVFSNLMVKGRAVINMGAGADVVALEDIRVDGALTIDLGSGVNELYVNDATFTRFFRLLGGADADLVEIEGVVGSLYATRFEQGAEILLGGGDDSLSLGSAGDAAAEVFFLEPSLLDGGADTDTLLENNVFFAAGSTVVNFELP